MEKYKRKGFFVKGNFQINFILGFILLLFIEVMLAATIIYKLSYGATEDAMFKSHLLIEKSSQIVGPIILKVNLCVIVISVVLAGILTLISYFRHRVLFDEIIRGLENLKSNHTAFRINLGSGKKAQELVKEFNQAAAYLDKHLADLRADLDELLVEKEFKNIKQLHNRLFSLLAEKTPE